jgi:hypothetical protein
LSLYGPGRDRTCDLGLKVREEWLRHDATSGKVLRLPQGCYCSQLRRAVGAGGKPVLQSVLPDVATPGTNQPQGLTSRSYRKRVRSAQSTRRDAG